MVDLDQELWDWFEEADKIDTMEPDSTIYDMCFIVFYGRGWDE